MTVGPDMEGRHVVVTGGASGIGAALVEAFAGAGARVTFVDIDTGAGHALAEALGGKVRFAQLDLTDLGRIGATMTRICAEDGIDVLVNGAANDTRHKTDAVTPKSWRRTLAVNLDHQFFCAQAVLPSMRAQESGAILNFGSLACREGLVDAVGYVTAKAAIEGMTHSLARENGPFGIRVNCLLPGFVRTERQVDKWLTPELHDEVMRRQCLKRFTEPGDIAEVAVFLCSDRARALTNQTILVDGGWS